MWMGVRAHVDHDVWPRVHEEQRPGVQSEQRHKNLN